MLHKCDCKIKSLHADVMSHVLSCCIIGWNTESYIKVYGLKWKKTLLSIKM